MEPVTGLDVLHLAGNIAKEDGHVPLHWELTFPPPLSGKARFTFFRNKKWGKISQKPCNSH